MATATAAVAAMVSLARKLTPAAPSGHTRPP